jgi:membrane protease YdiL (CAAX protease family)
VNPGPESDSLDRAAPQPPLQGEPSADPSSEALPPAASTDATRPAAELDRYPFLRTLSLVLIVGGGVAVAYALLTTAGLLSGDVLAPGTPSGAFATLAILLLGGIALLLGLVISAVRSIVVREVLPADRYRGPSIIVLWLLATIAANLAVVPVASELSRLLEGEQPSIYGTIVTLTATQAGLVGAAALLVWAPRALAGLRLVPVHGLLRSMAIGLGIAIPSWIGAQLIGYLTVRLLEPFGMRPETGVADAALSNADPVVLVVAIVVVAPIAEELFFRGVVFNAWEREYGVSRAVLGSAVLFAVIHGSPFLIPSILALGIVLALVYRSTRSLAATITLHAVFNGITVLLALLVRFNVLDIPVT